MINKNVMFSIFGFFIILGAFLIIKINYNQINQTDNKYQENIPLNISSIAKALQCQRETQHLESIAIDPKLSSEAQHILDTLAHDLEARPEPLLDTQPWWYLGVISNEDQPDTCDWNIDLDIAETSNLQAIGIGFLPAVDYAPATVLILGR